MSDMNAVISKDHVTQNIAIYALNGIAPYYTKEPLSPPEIHILLKYKAKYDNKTVLDIGVGTGRTSKYLAPYCKRYVGIDLSKPMLDLFDIRLPHVKIIHCDMRDFHKINEDKFQFVFGPFAAFDALNHQDRLRMLRDIHAMMSPSGLFVFSTHNLNWQGIGKGPRLERTKDPLRMIRNFISHHRSVKNHNNMRALEERYETYAILNDISHQWLALLYYITREQQTLQLQDTGFEVLEVYDNNGNVLETTASDAHCSALYYVCRHV